MDKCALCGYENYGELRKVKIYTAAEPPHTCGPYHPNLTEAEIRQLVARGPERIEHRAGALVVNIGIGSRTIERMICFKRGECRRRAAGAPAKPRASRARRPRAEQDIAQ